MKVTKQRGRPKAMREFTSISQLVVFRLKNDPSYPYDRLTAEVHKTWKQLGKKGKSKWGPTHFSWYKSAIRGGRVKVQKPNLTY